MADGLSNDLGEQAACGCACHGSGHDRGCDHCKVPNKIDAPTLPVEEKKTEKEDEFAEDRKRLIAMQKGSEKVAMAIGREAVAHMMSLGWTFDGGITVVKDDKGKVVSHRGELMFRPLNLAEWQEVCKEKLRRKLTLN